MLFLWKTAFFCRARLQCFWGFNKNHRTAREMFGGVFTNSRHRKKSSLGVFPLRAWGKYSFCQSGVGGWFSLVYKTCKNHVFANWQTWVGLQNIVEPGVTGVL